MDTQNQWRIFLLCVLIGLIGGVLYELFSVVRFLLVGKGKKRKALGAAVDILYSMAFALVCIYGAYAFDFPDFRVYMWIGYLVGGIIYLKSLHKIIAFFKKVCYNSINLLIKKAKKREKTLFEEERSL